MRRFKAIISYFLALMLCSFSMASFAEIEPVKWNDAKDHNRWTEWMLFGNPSYSSYKTPEIKLRVEQLEDALLLCIDQFNGSYEEKLAKLSFIRNVPDELSSIDFKAGTNHRVYTHRGWNHVYAQFEIEKSHPDTRKQLLIAVVEYVFPIKRYTSSEQATKVCDAMGSLLYNMHVIEDRFHSRAYYGAASTLLLSDSSTQTESVTHDLLDCLPILFPNQKNEKNSADNELVSGLRRISNSVVSARKNNNSTEAFILIDRQYAEELKDLLAEYLPKLLQMQQWFLEAFPANWNSN